jgi:sugar O-acyltransferase (sialic acid O-acetyltransferase NeuD family)
MPRTKEILILGTGGNCIDILDTIQEINSSRGPIRYRCIGFLDDDSDRLHRQYYGFPVLGPLSSAADYKRAVFVNGIGSPTNYTNKKAIIEKTGLGAERFETLVHPSAVVSKMARLGTGNVVFQNAVITSNVKIGDHVIILPNSVVSHDDIIGDYVCIAGGVCISGGVRIGESCYLGTNCTIIANISIGEYSMIGMGSVVLKDVPSHSVYVGNPARLLRKIKPDS